MKTIRQFGLILGFSFLGEVLHAVLPAIPASIYGLLALFGALALKLVKREQIKETGAFLTGLLPLLFVAPVVSLLDCWELVVPALLPILTVIVVSTLVTFAVSGRTTQLLAKRRGRRETNA